MTNNQAIKIATMMLQAANYEAPFITLHPIVTRDDEREAKIWQDMNAGIVGKMYN